MEKKEKINLVPFIAMMGSATLALASKSILGGAIGTTFAYIIEISIIALFSWKFGVFIWHIARRWGRVWEDLKTPLRANLYPTISISAALICLMLVKIGLPYLGEYSIPLASVFWGISLVLSLIFVIVIPINIKFRSRVEEVIGTWFIPPVGLFVLVSAGSALATRVEHWAGDLLVLNLLILGPAFVLYFLTLSLLYFRTKFHEPPAAKLTPTFNIVLAPVGVSILAMLLTAQLLKPLQVYGLHEVFPVIAKLYAIIMMGYGVWVVLGLLMLYYRISREGAGIPFSEMWWAFVFPLGAYTVASSLVSSIYQMTILRALSYVLYGALLVLWTYVLTNYIIKRVRGK